MGTLIQDLNLLKENKENIKQAIEEKGQTIADTDALSSYPNKIRAIETRKSQDKTATITINSASTLSKTLTLSPDSEYNCLSSATVTAKVETEERIAAMSTLANVVVTPNSGKAAMTKVTVTPPTVQGTRTYAIPADANNSSYNITTNQSGAVGMQKVSISGAYGSTTVTNYGNDRYNAGVAAGAVSTSRLVCSVGANSGWSGAKTATISNLPGKKCILLITVSCNNAQPSWSGEDYIKINNSLTPTALVGSVNVGSSWTIQGYAVFNSTATSATLNWCQHELGYIRIVAVW